MKRLSKDGGSSLGLDLKKDDTCSVDILMSPGDDLEFVWARQINQKI